MPESAWTQPRGWSQTTSFSGTTLLSVPSSRGASGRLEEGREDGGEGGGGRGGKDERVVKGGKVKKEGEGVGKSREDGVRGR